MNIAIIGCGSMASSLVTGYHLKQKDLRFFCFTPSGERAKKLAKAVDGIFVESLSDFKNHQIDYWLLGMKPQNLHEFAQEFLKLNLKNSQIISMLAAVKIEVLEKKLKTPFIARIMPNTPVKISQGMTLFCFAAVVNQKQKDFTAHFLNKTSKTCELSEELLEKATVLSGSGPAYFYLFTQSLAQALSKLGIDEKTSLLLARETFIGSANLINADQELSLEEQIMKVTSKGGVTIEAVESFRANKLEELCIKALESALKRSDEIGQELLSK